MILLLAGTSDARELAATLQSKGYSLLATVVTQSAANSLKEAGIEVHMGRLDSQQLAMLAQNIQAKAVVDASHPFAEEASRNAMDAARFLKLPYFRYERPREAGYSYPLITKVQDYEEAAEQASHHQGVVMLTTGSKTLEVFTKKLLGKPGLTLIARMLPRLDNMEKCEKLGVEQKNMIAMQGPFSRELNAAMYRQYGVSLVISKESGKQGSVDEKIEAAMELGIPVILIQRPGINYGTAYSDYQGVVEALKKQVGKEQKL